MPLALSGPRAQGDSASVDLYGESAGQIAALLETGDTAVPAATAAWKRDAASAVWSAWLAERWCETGRGALALPVWRALLGAGRISADSIRAVAARHLREDAPADRATMEEIRRMLAEEGTGALHRH